MVNPKNKSRNNYEAINNDCQCGHVEESSSSSSSSPLTLEGGNFPCGYCQCILTSFIEMVDHVKNAHSMQNEYTYVNNTGTQTSNVQGE